LWHDDFITDETIKSWYKAWVSHLLNRVNTVTGVVYKDDPTIMAWELANEMRCSESGPYLSSAACNSSTILAWVDEMSTFVKSIDRNHLVSFGSEGFLCSNYGRSDTLTNCTESADPVAVTALPNIDLHGIHIYPDHWNPTEPTDDWAAWGVWWIEQQAAIANDAGKPFYIGEYGWRGKDTRLPVFERWLTAAYDAGADGTNFWMMQPTNPGFTPADNDGFVVYCPSAVCTLVSRWNAVVGGQAEWNDFGPIGDGEFVTTSTGEETTFSLVANDLAFGDAQLDLSTVDLDPTSSGIQSSLSLERGTYAVRDGIVTFTPLPGVEGSARMQYTIADSLGRVSDPISVSVVIISPSGR
jgi:mannan endo-1,4-beta-mannosidase